MDEEKGMGVSRTVKDNPENLSGESREVEIISLRDSPSDTIYNLLFKEFDKEKKNG